MFRFGIIIVVSVSLINSGNALTFAAGSTTGKKSAGQAKPTLFQGTVAIVTNSHLVLATPNVRRTFVVSPDATIVVNRAEASLDDVKPGHFASVAGSNADGQLVASFIQATRQY